MSDSKSTEQNDAIVEEFIASLDTTELTEEERKIINNNLLELL